jgi:ATP-dependent Clp protease ATP-binding subunit ClpA
VERRLTERKLSLEITEGARDLLAEQGWDPTYGARPLKRAIQRHLLDRLALEVLEGAFHEGDTVVVDRDGSRLVFRTKQDIPEIVAAAS